MTNVAMSINTVNTATAIAAIAPALRPLPESPGEPFDGIVVFALPESPGEPFDGIVIFALPESLGEPFDGMVVSVLYKIEYTLALKYKRNLISCGARFNIVLNITVMEL